ncbi:CoA transferase [Brachybacterium sp. YJGR34]|uniref:CoA transferase n=1 Tax=Brachybacterium sp. YJGR34 TaxID=2059911 RepID=UPI000E0CA350|nr:CoA transferase [Brachybacterium sp. YJGR34]
MEIAPRRWWRCPLDVESLAGTAVGRVRAAAAELAAVRGLDVEVTTAPRLVAASFAAYEMLRIDGRAPDVWAELSGVVAARDGWVRLHGNYPHHAEITRAVLGIEDRAGLERAIAARAAEEVAAELSAAGGIAVAVRTAEQWEAGPHARAVAGDPWSVVEDRGARPVPGPLHGGAAPLTGIRVLDLTRVIAGPTATQLLACLGAEVLRVDPPHRPEILAQHLSTGMGKRSAEVDLRRDASAVRALAAQADVILGGYRPGALAALGLGTEGLEELAPHAVIVALSAWGEHGPWGRRAGFDSIVQAASGIAAICGADGRPGALPVQALDHSTGHLLAAHVLEALTAGRAVTVRASLLGAARTLLALPPPPAAEPEELLIPRVEVPFSGGVLRAVPPPLLLDGLTIERPVGTYGAARPQWREE